MKLFIDDERFPTGADWIIARNMADVIAVVEYAGMPNYISFDHDLGDNEPTGYDICKWLVDQVMDDRLQFPDGFDFYVHSQNPIGKANIEGYLNGFLSMRK